MIIRDKYIDDVKKAFVVKNKNDQKYLDDLISRINKFYDDYPNLSMNEYINCFGSPENIYKEYKKQQKSNSKVKNARVVMISICVIAIFIAAFFLYHKYQIDKLIDEDSQYYYTEEIEDLGEE